MAPFHLWLNYVPNNMARAVQDLVARQLPGYAIGGLAGGEDKDSFWRYALMSS